MHTPVLDSFRLDGKVALITGGARGLGLTMATALAEAGANVALAGRNIGPCEEAAAAITSATGRRAESFAADVTSAADIERLVASVEASLGRIDILINNAGVYSRWSRHWDPDATLFDTVTQEELVDTFRINAAGPMLVIEHFLNLVRASPRGRILNVSSRVGSVSAKTSGGDYAYAASKAALNIMTRALAAELAPEGIVVIAITPGWVRTEMGGRAAALSPEESVRGILSVAAKLTLKHAGRFLDYQGEDQPW